MIFLWKHGFTFELYKEHNNIQDFYVNIVFHLGPDNA